jgi:hypothetical protein
MEIKTRHQQSFIVSFKIKTTSMDNVKPEIKAIEKRSKVLADVLSRTVGPLIGAIAGGPIGAVAGGVAGTLIKYGLEEFLDRFLTPKEVRRVGTSAEFIINGINKKLENGDQLNEPIFHKKDGMTSDAEELFEGVLLKCKNEYQEKKIKYLSNIFVNISFDPTISADNANQILMVAERLSYRQMCLLSLIGKNDDNSYHLRTVDNRTNFNQIKTETLVFILRDFWDLNNSGLIHRRDRMGIGNFVDPAPSVFILYPLGVRLFQLMKLDEIPYEEFTFIGELK